ncbi:MAG TPA: replication-relaxation family protein [Microbacteriaceae bacterium]|nr:replication-relaxation family protein [Microbacteriaceae bacterium]
MTRPIARRIAQRPNERNPHALADSPQFSTGKDSAFAPSIYITTGRLERIASEMTELDWSLLSFVATSRLATSKHLVCRFFTDDPKADPARARAGSRALKRLSDWRVLDPLPGRARGGVRGGSATLIYSVGVGGRKLLARRGLHLRRLGAPGERHVNHVLACTGVVVDLCAADARGELDLIEVQQEPTCHRAFLGAWGARLWVRPDLFVRIGVGALEDRWFIEIDLATEHAGTLLAKAKRYLLHYRSGSEQAEFGVYPRVVWAVPDARRGGQVKEVQRHLPAEARKMFVACQLDELVACLGEEARS